MFPIRSSDDVRIVLLDMKSDFFKSLLLLLFFNFPLKGEVVEGQERNQSPSAMSGNVEGNDPKSKTSSRGESGILPLSTYIQNSNRLCNFLCFPCLTNKIDPC